MYGSFGMPITSAEIFSLIILLPPNALFELFNAMDDAKSGKRNVRIVFLQGMNSSTALASGVLSMGAMNLP